MTFNRVLTVWDYYDGPRSGIAEYEGRPHYYESEWDEAAGVYAETFRLSPVDDETVHLALNQWKIWREWELAFHRGEKEHSTHPELSGQDSMYAQLESELQARITSLTGFIRATGEFRPVAGQADLPRGVMKDLEVEWRSHASSIPT